MNNYNPWHVNRWWSCHLDGLFTCIPLQVLNRIFPFVSNSKCKIKFEIGVFPLFDLRCIVVIPTRKHHLCFAVLDLCIVYMIILWMERKSTQSVYYCINKIIKWNEFERIGCRQKGKDAIYCCMLYNCRDERCIFVSKFNGKF